MPFVEQKFILKQKVRAISFLQQRFGVPLSKVQKMIDKGRVSLNGEVFLNKSGFLQGEVSVSSFVVVCDSKSIDNAESDSYNPLKPIFESNDFVVFDKPCNMLTHPKGRFYHYSLLDSIKLYNPQANPINRIDYQTSGLVIAGLSKSSEVELKRLFECRRVKKSYLALVCGRVGCSEINAPLLKQDKRNDLGIRSVISPFGKPAITQIKTISYNEDNNTSLLLLSPLTGRTHQLRVHLSHIGHRILGDPLYGVSDELSRDYLDGKIPQSQFKECFGANRLMLHAKSLEFEYKGLHYFINSNLAL